MWTTSVSHQCGDLSQLLVAGWQVQMCIASRRRDVPGHGGALRPSLKTNESACIIAALDFPVPFSSAWQPATNWLMVKRHRLT